MFYTQKHKDNFKILANMVDNQSNRIANLEDKLDSFMKATRYGLKKDGTPKAKPGRKPKELNPMQELEQVAIDIVSNYGQEEFLKMVRKIKPPMPKGFKEL